MCKIEGYGDTFTIIIFSPEPPQKLKVRVGWVVANVILVSAQVL